MRMHRYVVCSLSMALIASFLFILQPPAARAQQRVSDKDMNRMMKNMRYDTKSFRSSFDNALGKSTIRKTSHAKDAKNLVMNFQNQVDAMLNRFKKNRNDGDGIVGVVNTAGQIDSLLYSVSFGPEVMAKWQRIREEIHPIALPMASRKVTTTTARMVWREMIRFHVCSRRARSRPTGE